MNFISPELDIHLLADSGSANACLYFKFKGKLTKETSKAGALAWLNHMDEKAEDNFEFVWDCKEMTGFELQARKEWYNAMQTRKDRITKVYVVSNHLMIRSAAKVMLQFFGIPSEINRSEDQLPATIRL